MAELNWHYVENQFFTATYYSYKKMDLFSTDHISRLKSQQGDPVFDEMISFISPYQLKFLNKLTEWKANVGIYHGYTLVFEDMIKELVNVKIPTWSARVGVVFHRNTNEYNSIFFKGLSIFGESSYENRLSEVDTLCIKLTKYPEFADLAVEVKDYYNKLNTARDQQQNYEGLVKVSRTYLKEVHKDLADALYRNLGMLMVHFYNEPNRITDFFELEQIQRKIGTEEVDEEAEIAALNPDGTLMNV